MFIEFKQKITKEYTLLTGLLLLCVSLCIYITALAMSYEEQLNQLKMLAVEESEEFFYQISTGKIDDFSSEDLPDSEPGYFNKIFIYAYKADGTLVFSHNDIAWDKTIIESEVIHADLRYRETYFDFELIDSQHPHAMIYMRYPLQKDAQQLGELYVGIDTTHWLREQMRVFFSLLFIVLLSMLAVYFLANKMADRAMVPVIKSFEQQKQFIANASHELRTPLSIIMSGMDVLRSDDDNKLSPFSKDIISDISDESRRMKKLIDDLLMTARSDNDTLKVDIEPLDLPQLLHQLYHKFSLLASKQQIELSLQDIPESIIRADKNHVHQILTILLDNAIKYTGKGGRISVSAQGLPHNIAISIADSGQGISAKDLPHVFERFYRADKSRETKGNGLGLYIAKLLAEKNNGSLTVKSTLGKGSCFKLTLPKV